MNVAARLQVGGSLLSDVVFATPHGSHLYGFAHEGSDHDSFVVTFSDRGKVRQCVDEVDDIATVGWRTFLEYAKGGSHQSVEALFSPAKVWTSKGVALRPLIEGTRVYGGDVFEKYERTIRKFSYGTFKRRRHAARLYLNLNQLREYGMCRVRLTPEQVEWATGMAEFEGDNLLARLDL